jgi:hypothetical protein
MWYASETGDSFYRTNQISQALKCYHQIQRHFNDIFEDEFDFHAYAIRKVTMRAYVDMLRSHDRLRSHPYYVKAAKKAVEVYLKLFFTPAEYIVEGVDTSNLPQEERDNLIKKSIEKAGYVWTPDPKDPDPLGLQFLKGDYLAEASKFLDPLLKLTSDIEAFTLGCELYMAKKKYLLVLKCILRIFSVSPEDPNGYYNLVRLSQKIENMELHPLTHKILHEKTQALISEPFVQYNDNYIKRFKTPEHINAAAKVMLLLNSKDADKAVKLLKGIKIGTLKVTTI